MGYHTLLGQTHSDFPMNIRDIMHYPIASVVAKLARGQIGRDPCRFTADYLLSIFNDSEESVKLLSDIDIKQCLSSETQPGSIH